METEYKLNTRKGLSLVSKKMLYLYGRLCWAERWRNWVLFGIITTVFLCTSKNWESTVVSWFKIKLSEYCTASQLETAHQPLTIPPLTTHLHNIFITSPHSTAPRHWICPDGPTSLTQSHLPCIKFFFSGITWKKCQVRSGYWGGIEVNRW